MKSRTITALALGLALALTATAAYADFTPKFELALSDLKVNANPTFDIHLEFDAQDEEIRSFKMTIPKGFVIASDEDIPAQAGPIPSREERSGEEIGGGSVTIQAGPDCRPGPEGAIPVSAPVTIDDATIYERSRTDEEADAGVHAVWFLDIEPLNRVRLLVTGDPTTGWTVEGAPTPSDNTCNPLTVDLQINGKSESGIPVITNPAKPGKKTFLVEIGSQDSPSVAVFKPAFKITK